ncbi:hypothetical protein PHAVU_011G202601 [Phaseolus vulgaris]
MGWNQNSIDSRKESTLEWGRVGTLLIQKKEEDVIENLGPSKNLKELSICRYGGKRFPNWLLENSLWNMVSLMLFECESCESLPPLGLLPFLKVLEIIKLDGIVSINGDFHGNNSSSFKSLETLNFSLMSQWEKWECQDVIGAFPRLRHLSISSCPRLIRQLPEQLISLERLEIEDCRQLEVSAPRLTMKTPLLEIVGSSNTFENLEIDSPNDDCVSLQSFPLDLFPAIRTLDFTWFENLQMISQSLVHNHLEELTLKYCFVFESLPGSMHMLLPYLRRLYIRDCPELKTFPNGGFPSNLEEMTIKYCPKLESFPDGGFPSNLQTLKIKDCPRLKSFPDRRFPSNLQILTMVSHQILKL